MRVESISTHTRPKVYTTNHVHSKVLCSAFAEGCGGSIVPPGRLLDGPAVVYGILRGCGDIIKQCQWVNRDFYHIDHGYFLRGHYDGYYRVSFNGFQCEPYGPADPTRWERLNVPLRPWKRRGRHVVICPISQMVAEFLHVDPVQWLNAVIAEISLHTDRPVIIKPKDGKPLASALEDAWCLVTHSSNAAVDAAVAGVPVITLGESCCEAISWDFENIESPHWPYRENWVHWLANNQWTIDEIRSGEAWTSLTNTG